MAAVDPLPSGVLRHISAVLGDTVDGLTGRQIGSLLSEARIDDPGEMTKKDRLFEAFYARQARDNAANAVLACLKLALSPDRFLYEPEKFDMWRDSINEALAFVGLVVTEQGKIQYRNKNASTLSEARARANRFREALRDRNVHHLVISGCASEIEDENYFHAVFPSRRRGGLWRGRTSAVGRISVDQMRSRRAPTAVESTGRFPEVSAYVLQARLR